MNSTISIYKLAYILGSSTASCLSKEHSTKRTIEEVFHDEPYLFLATHELLAACWILF
jgi:hypothetical protein